MTKIEDHPDENWCDESACMCGDGWTAGCPCICHTKKEAAPTDLVEVGPPPIHEHYNPETDRSELCGHVFCPHGFVGLSRKKAAPVEHSESLLPEKLAKRVITYNGHHYIRVKYVNDYLHYLKGQKPVEHSEWAEQIENLIQWETPEHEKEVKSFIADLISKEREAARQEALVDYMRPIMMTATEVGIEERARIALERAKENLRKEGAATTLTRVKEMIAGMRMKVPLEGRQTYPLVHNAALDTLLDKLNEKI